MMNTPGVSCTSGRIPSDWPKALRLGAAALIVFAAMLAPVAAIGQANANREQVLSFDSTITIRRNATLLVQEDITVRAFGVAIQNGIYREFVPQAGRPAPGVRVIDAQLDGKPVPYQMQEENGSRRIFLGEADTPLVTGDHEFLLTYETPEVVIEHGARDRLDWNVTGDSWSFPITDISAAVVMPEGVPQDTITVEGNTGGNGDTGKNYIFDLDTPGKVTFTAGPLPSKQGLAVSVEFPSGYVHHGGRIPLFLLDHPVLSTIVAGFFILLLVWAITRFLQWRRKSTKAAVTTTA